MIYAPTDTTSVTVPVERGGCGSSHEVALGEPGRPSTLVCATCEPHIMALNTGWAHQPHQVALTPDEIGEAEARESVAAREKSRTWSDPNAFAETMVKAMRGEATPAAGMSLLAQIAALSVEERAALSAMLNASVPSAATQPTEPDEEPVPAAMLSTAVDDTVDEPVRRGPGRPRKNP